MKRSEPPHVGSYIFNGRFCCRLRFQADYRPMDMQADVVIAGGGIGGGTVIMGDAAHSVSPAGGQGANMSVADAVLAELFLRGEPNLIAEYERRRRPANERSLGPTRFAHPALGLPGWMVPNICRRALLRWLSRHPAPAQRALRSISRLFQEAPAS